MMEADLNGKNRTTQILFWLRICDLLGKYEPSRNSHYFPIPLNTTYSYTPLPRVKIEVYGRTCKWSMTMVCEVRQWCAHHIICFQQWYTLCFMPTTHIALQLHWVACCRKRSEHEWCMPALTQTPRQIGAPCNVDDMRTTLTEYALRIPGVPLGHSLCSIDLLRSVSWKCHARVVPINSPVKPSRRIRIIFHSKFKFHSTSRRLIMLHITRIEQ